MLDKCNEKTIFDLNFNFFGVDYFKISKVLEKTNNFLECVPRFQYDFFSIEIHSLFQYGIRSTRLR